ncbi:MAG: nucleoside deaminase [Lactobacillus sp.]|nr:nucleoside deaminase [Lactobacillus sp.]
MDQAIACAQQAAALDEVPIGAIIVDHGQIIARAFNHRELDQSATAHAEILAIQQACLAKGSWRLTGMDLFVTLEPCVMCAGAIINSRLDSVYFGAYDPKAGAAGSVVDVFSLEKLNHHPQVIGGVAQAKTGALLTDFFREIRRQKKLRAKASNSAQNEL